MTGEPGPERLTNMFQLGARRRPRRPSQPRDTRESLTRAFFRKAGFRVDSVSFIRGHNDEFMAIRLFPASDVGAVVNLLSNKANTTLEITRIHLGRSGEARVYIRFIDQPEPTMTWDQIEEALRRHQS